MSAFLEQLGVGVGVATYGGLLGGVGWVIKLLHELKSARTTQDDWNATTSRGLIKLTDDVEDLEDVTAKHSNQLRKHTDDIADDRRRLKQLERRMQAHERLHDRIARRLPPEPDQHDHDDTDTGDAA